MWLHKHVPWNIPKKKREKENDINIYTSKYIEARFSSRYQS